MGFTLTAEQRAWRDQARDFAQETIRPQAAALDRAGTFPDALVAGLGRRGFLGLTLPPEWGGTGGDTIAYCLALEELARADAGIAITIEAHISLGCAPPSARRSSGRASCRPSPAAQDSGPSG